MFSFYAYPILIFHACIPIGVVIHPVDVSLAAGGGDADERRARCHALRGYEGFVDEPLPAWWAIISPGLPSAVERSMVCVPSMTAVIVMV